MGQKQKGSSNGFLPRCSLSLTLSLALCVISQWLPLAQCVAHFFAFGFSGCFACHSFCHFHFNFHSHAAAHAVIRMCFRCFVLLTIFAAVKQQICRPLANCFRSTILIVIVIDAPFRFGACLSFFLSIYVCMYVCRNGKANEPQITVLSRTYIQMWPIYCKYGGHSIARSFCCYCRLFVLFDCCYRYDSRVVMIIQRFLSRAATTPLAPHRLCPAMRSFNKVRFNFALQ